MRFEIISSIIAAILFGFAMLAIDYYNNEMESIGKYVFQIVFFGLGLIIIDYISRKKFNKN